MTYPQHVKDLALALYKGDESAREPLHDALVEIGCDEKIIYHHLLDPERRCQPHQLRGCHLIGNIFGDGDFIMDGEDGTWLKYTNDTHRKTVQFLKDHNADDGYWSIS